jgi:hypothetical protein
MAESLNEFQVACGGSLIVLILFGVIVLIAVAINWLIRR